MNERKLVVNKSYGGVRCTLYVNGAPEIQIDPITSMVVVRGTLNWSLIYLYNGSLQIAAINQNTEVELEVKAEDTKFVRELEYVEITYTFEK